MHGMSRTAREIGEPVQEVKIGQKICTVIFITGRDSGRATTFVMKASCLARPKCFLLALSTRAAPHTPWLRVEG